MRIILLLEFLELEPNFPRQIRNSWIRRDNRKGRFLKVWNKRKDRKKWFRVWKKMRRLVDFETTRTSVGFFFPIMNDKDKNVNHDFDFYRISSYLGYLNRITREPNKHNIDTRNPNRIAYSGLIRFRFSGQILIPSLASWFIAVCSCLYRPFGYGCSNWGWGRWLLGLSGHVSLSWIGADLG